MAQRQRRNAGRRCTCAAEGGESSPRSNGASNHPWHKELQLQNRPQQPGACFTSPHLQGAGCSLEEQLPSGLTASRDWLIHPTLVIGSGEPCCGLVAQRGAESLAWALNSAPGCGGQWPNVTQELRGAERGVILLRCLPCGSAGLAGCLAQGVLDREVPALHLRGACRPPQADGVLAGEVRDNPNKGSHIQEYWLPQQAAQSEHSHPCGSHCSTGR